jgi:bifunctional UDP-N-acetylglucosamine pyrophosphorylase/glucosamine-1-phosphate N-acetyltransferase
MPPTAIILAAGKSTRMKSARPKPLHEVCGRPMLEYVLRACYEAGCERVVVVVGHGKDEVVGAFAGDDRIQWVEQLEQLGTGHAARMCEPALAGHEGDVFILAGDGPLIRGEVLQTLLQAHEDDGADASMATAVLDDPTGYGRIIRDDAGEFVEIVEQADATPAQREIREVFPSYYCVKAAALRFALSRITNQNKKGEYYLTDLYAVLRRAGKRVLAVQAVTAEDAMAVNDRMQQAEVDAIMQDRIHRKLRSEGVTIVSSTAVYIEDGAAIGRDTTVYPFTFVGRDASVGRECVVGPFAAVPRGAIVSDGTTVAGNAAAETATLSVGGTGR